MATNNPTHSSDAGSYTVADLMLVPLSMIALFCPFIRY
jgi:hypothetical protein